MSVPTWDAPFVQQSLFLLKAPKLLISQRKTPMCEHGGLYVWWSWRELNPRPQAFVRQIYMFSTLI